MYARLSFLRLLVCMCLHNNKKLRHFIILYIQQRLHMLNISKERKIAEEGRLLSNILVVLLLEVVHLESFFFAFFHNLIRGVLVEAIFSMFVCVCVGYKP